MKAWIKSWRRNTKLVGLIANILTGCAYELKFQVKGVGSPEVSTGINHSRSWLCTITWPRYKELPFGSGTCITLWFCLEKKTVFNRERSTSLVDRSWFIFGCRYVAASLWWRDHSGVRRFKYPDFVFSHPPIPFLRFGFLFRVRRRQTSLAAL